jgi:hypothetical protein
MRIISIYLLIAGVMAGGCATRSNTPYAEFIRSVDFTHFDTVRIAPMAAGDLAGVINSSSIAAVLQATVSAIQSALYDKDFTILQANDQSSDLLVTAYWREIVNEPDQAAPPIINPNPSDPDRPAAPSMPPARGGFQLIIEIADSRTGNVFWRATSAPEAALFAPTPSSAGAAAQRLMANFPQRVEKDPSLPHISLQPTGQSISGIIVEVLDGVETGT